MLHVHMRVSSMPQVQTKVPSMPRVRTRVSSMLHVQTKVPTISHVQTKAISTPLIHITVPSPTTMSYVPVESQLLLVA